MSVIKTTIITGYLGVGKTTLINNLLKQSDGLRIAVIVNEFGDLGIDGDLILNTNEEIIELTNGCLCCSVRGDLISALISLKPRLATLDALFIETSGLADPVPVAQTFLIGEDELQDFKLDGVITLIDARHGIPILKSEVEAKSQVAFADRLILTKSDLVDNKTLVKIKEEIRMLNLSAPILSSVFGEVPLDDIMDIGAFDIEKIKLNSNTELDRHTHNEDIQCITFTSNRSIDPDTFMQWMQQLIVIYGDRILRSKGVLDFLGETRRFVFHGVQTVLDGDVQEAWPKGPRQSRLILIGRELNVDVLRTGWENCYAEFVSKKLL